MLANRYRIVSLIGRGGMGEVYRAEDLKLAQAVALKFLPEEFALSSERLARFHQEVRMARQVSHPNVCRVYDIGEAEGLQFLSMEYVDGEDLASLLRRIGRLPVDKATQMARQLCSGLAAAHDRGVLHRDLKPANVLIDGRGQVRIADFGLASLSDDARELHPLAGTPAYMAPEQREGRGASVRSDVFALGLVLYEIFTGVPATAASAVPAGRSGTDSSRPKSLSTVIPDIDPAIERVIVRCLETDPALRPASALAVAAALPGGNPLAAALAAGETPSPDMVAAAGDVGGVSPKIAVTCLAIIILGALPLPWISWQVGLMQYINLEKSTGVLENRASEIARNLGYTDRELDSASGYVVDDEQLRFIANKDGSPTRWLALAGSRPPVLSFWHRVSPQLMLPTSGSARVAPHDPPLTTPGMLLVETDPDGQLTRLIAVPRSAEPQQQNATPDWTRVFKEAGLDVRAFSPVQSTRTPPVYADTRAAWQGSVANRPDAPIRIEAAAVNGTPVYFEIVGPWTTEASPGPVASPLFILLITLFTYSITLLLARHNLRVGRGDRRGALRLGVWFGSALLASVALESHNLAALIEEIPRVVFQAFAASIGYLALEPHLRRLWPESLIAWSRLLGGRLRDPLVGRDVLIGSVAGVLIALVLQSEWIVPRWLGITPPTPRLPDPSDRLLMGGRMTLNAIVGVFTGDVGIGLGLVLALVVLHLVLRRRALAAAALVLILLVVSPVPVFGEGNPFVRITVSVVFAVSLVWLIVRFGFLTTIVCGTISRLLVLRPMSLDPSLPYSTGSYFILAVAAVIVIYGFHTALAGRTLFGQSFWGDEPSPT
jgi:serine/threonine-protein kinase